MFRLYFGIFWGKAKTYSDHHKPHESPWIMCLPLLFLAVLSCVTGIIPFADFVSSDNMSFHTHIEWSVALPSIGVALAGILVAAALYMRGNSIPERIAMAFGGFYRAVHRKFYMDELWMFVTKRVVFKHISTPIARFDRKVIDGAMDNAGTATQRASAAIKGLQSGRVQMYAWVFVLGTLAIVVWTLFL
jgi:NADH-quinone oxidoreductase subunit L